MIYQFDEEWNGRVVSELVDPHETKDLYKGEGNIGEENRTFFGALIF